MAISHEFDKIINRVKGITADANNIYWSKDDLISFINEGQEEYCEKTLTLRAEGPLTTRENSQIYNLPTDCHLVDRIEDENGDALTKTTSRDLERMFGNRFRNALGSPSHYYQNLDGIGQIRFYPNPSTDLRATYETFDADLGGNISSDDDDAVAETYDSELGAVIDTDQEDDTAYDTFNFDTGLVTGVLATTGKLRVFYARNPRPDIYEINDLQALQYYALHKCYEKDGPFQDFKKSMHYELKFQERVGEERGRVSSGQHAQISVRGSYA